MGYALKRGIKFLFKMFWVALIAGCILYAVKSAIDLGDEMIKNTDEKYEYSEPTEGAGTAQRASEAISLDGSDL